MPLPDPVRLVWAKEATDYTSPFLRYKTTKREIYDAARARCGVSFYSPSFVHGIASYSSVHVGATLRPSADPFEPPFDVLMYNLDGQVTETSISNCAFCLDRRLSSAFVTPAAACGLLPGIQRQALLDQGQIEEGIVTRAELQHAVEVGIYIPPYSRLFLVVEADVCFSCPIPLGCNARNYVFQCSARSLHRLFEITSRNCI